MKSRNIISLVLVVGSPIGNQAFAGLTSRTAPRVTFVENVGKSHVILQMSSQSTTESFIQNELRGAAMRLHTREQAPREGEANSKQRPTYTPIHADYLSYLVDSQHVYKTMEEIVNTRSELTAFRSTGLERVVPLETDIAFMMSEYNLERPVVGKPGRDYVGELQKIESIPEFMCHYYNFYFAHTAGGRMIGKQMSSLLLNKKTLEFYKVCSKYPPKFSYHIPIVLISYHDVADHRLSSKILLQWDGDLNVIKDRVKDDIEKIAASWNKDERAECVAATASAFQGGGAINSYLSAGQSSRTA
jgi:heme oxygenase (biliverdin-producing, ferredoxin)